MKPSDIHLLKSKYPISASTLARNPVAGGVAHGSPPKVETPNASVILQRTTDEAKLNKTETAYLAFIRCLGFSWIGVQNVTLKLGNDTRYTVDFFIVDAKGHVQGREVKGFMREDAHVKIKVAARMFPWIEFQIVRKTKNGWDHQTVKP